MVALYVGGVRHDRTILYAGVPETMTFEVQMSGKVERDVGQSDEVLANRKSAKSCGKKKNRE